MKAMYFKYRFGQWMSGWMPEAGAWRIAETLSDIQWRRATDDVETVRRHLRLAVGSPVSADSLVVREVFRNFGRYLVEFFQGHRVRGLEVRIEGAHHLEAARERGRGAILVSAHLGNWELLGAVLVRRLGLPLSAVALPHGEARLDGLFNRQRERFGLKVIPLGAGAGAQCLRVLRQGGVIGLIGDWDFADTGLPVSMFGRIARLPRGPALLSLRSQAPLVPIFMLREGTWTFRVCIEPPIWPQDKASPGPIKPQARTSPSSVVPQARSRHDAMLQALTQPYATVLERYLHQAPTQWILFDRLLVTEGSLQTEPSPAIASPGPIKPQARVSPSPIAPQARSGPDSIQRRTGASPGGPIEPQARTSPSPSVPQARASEAHAVQ